MNIKAEETVEVLSKSEIIATLDERGELEGLPFMPEMLAYCGKRFRVSKRAHKTCDFVTGTGIRRLEGTVHLEELRCSGSAHGGCEAECLLYWKEAWLRRVGDTADTKAPATAEISDSRRAQAGRCDEEQIYLACKTRGHDSDEPVYSCQATRLPVFTQPASGWDISIYVEDYKSGNVKSLSQMIPRFLYRGYDNLVNLGIGIGPILRWIYDRFQGLRGGIPYPARAGRIKTGSPTPTGSLNLQTGEWVRVKSYEEILRTLDTSSKNRGMAFSAEMVPFCGKTYRVKNRVTRIVDEKTGRMLNMKNPCIILNGVSCRGMYNRSMLFCPRATYSYWREIWLERVDTPQTERDVTIKIALAREESA